MKRDYGLIILMFLMLPVLALLLRVSWLILIGEMK